MSLHYFVITSVGDMFTLLQCVKTNRGDMRGKPCNGGGQRVGCEVRKNAAEIQQIKMVKKDKIS